MITVPRWTGVEARILREAWRMSVRAFAATGVVESHADRQRYEETLGIDLVICRLLVDLALVERRLRNRHDRDDPTLAWHLNRAGELDSILDHARVEDHVVAAAHRTVREVAADVLAAAGCTGQPPAAHDPAG